MSECTTGQPLECLSRHKEAKSVVPRRVLMKNFTPELGLTFELVLINRTPSYYSRPSLFYQRTFL